MTTHALRCIDKAIIPQLRDDLSLVLNLISLPLPVVASGEGKWGVGDQGGRPVGAAVGNRFDVVLLKAGGLDAYIMNLRGVEPGTKEYELKAHSAQIMHAGTHAHNMPAPSARRSIKG